VVGFEFLSPLRFLSRLLFCLVILLFLGVSDVRRSTSLPRYGDEYGTDLPMTYMECRLRVWT
jgi:hypothetical protein